VPLTVIWTGTSSVTLPALAKVNVTGTVVPGNSALLSRMSSTGSAPFTLSASAWPAGTWSEIGADGVAALLLADADALLLVDADALVLADADELPDALPDADAEVLPDGVPDGVVDAASEGLGEAAALASAAVANTW
jgi:hypothetical protein